MVENWGDAIRPLPWYKSIKYWPMRFYNRIRYDVFQKIKFGFQRMFRGYDDTLLWNTNDYIAKLMLVGLKHLRENGHGFPPDLDEDTWNKYLDEMIYGFECYMTVYENNDFSNYSICMERFTHALNLVTKYYHQLWD